MCKMLHGLNLNPEAKYSWFWILIIEVLADAKFYITFPTQKVLYSYKCQNKFYCLNVIPCVQNSIIL